MSKDIYELFQFVKEDDQNTIKEACKHANCDISSCHKVCLDCGHEFKDGIKYDKEWRFYGSNDTRHTTDPNRCHMRKNSDKNILRDVAGLGFSDRIIDIANNISSNLNIQIFEKQELLEIVDLKKGLEKIHSFIEKETSVLSVEKKIRGRVKNQMEKTQREYYLNEQLKAIQKELGEIEDGKDENTSLNKAIIKARMPKEVEKKCLQELKKLKNMSPMSAEATVVRNYLDWMTELPWHKKSAVDIDLKKALEILDKDHFGLEKVKERIIEFLAVQKRMEKIKGPILCLVGPPGVGKTSLGKSIAKATNRQFIRMSLGGVRDEAEIRGHRRTYIGSLPGKIIQMMKKAGTKNPLFLLDEVDKIGNDYRGDPSSALLEALDPEQNTAFNDHYLEVDYDLSDVMFVTTANTLNILPPLLDRMEVIRIPGYTEDEKINIANKYLLPKQVKENGVKDGELNLEDGLSLIHI